MTFQDQEIQMANETRTKTKSSSPEPNLNFLRSVNKDFL